MPIATEKQFQITVEGVRMMGYIDRVDRLHGGLGIVDYKSNKDLFTADHLANDLQLTLYQIAAEQIWQQPVEKLTLYHLRSNTPCSVACRDPKHLTRAKNLVVEVAEKISAGIFPATENAYCPCDFAAHCPYYRHLYKPAEVTPTQCRLPGFEAAAAVEEYVSLQQQIKELEAKMDAIRQQIIDYCEASGVKRLFGSSYAITCNSSDRITFGEERVQQILEAAGLWGQTLSFDQARLKQLIADGVIEPTLKQQLEDLRQVTKSYMLRVKNIEPKDEAE